MPSGAKSPSPESVQSPKIPSHIPRDHTLDRFDSIASINTKISRVERQLRAEEHRMDALDVAAAAESERARGQQVAAETATPIAHGIGSVVKAKGLLGRMLHPFQRSAVAQAQRPGVTHVEKPLPKTTSHQNEGEFVSSLKASSHQNEVMPSHQNEHERLREAYALSAGACMKSIDTFLHADPSAEPASAMAVNAHLTDMHGMQDRLREDRVESEAWRTSFPPPEEIPLWRY